MKFFASTKSKIALAAALATITFAGTASANCTGCTPSLTVGAASAFSGWTKALNNTKTGNGGTKTNYSIADDVTSVKVDLVRTGSLCGPTCPAGNDNNAKITMNLAAMAGGTATHTTNTGGSMASTYSKVGGGAAGMATKTH